MPAAAAIDVEPRTIVRATAAQAADAIRLIEEYQDAVGVVVRDHPADIRAYLDHAYLDHAYLDEDGLDGKGKAIWLAYIHSEPVGCVAFRTLQQPKHAGEVKRLYVRDTHRSLGVAQQLMQALEADAAGRGYSALYLDSKDDLVAAIRFYKRMGYVPCPRYNNNPQATVFMKKDLILPLTIRSFEPRDAEAFRVLNEAWISKLFRLEPKDREVLNDPIGRIIAPGGKIFMVERDGKAIGCCGLIAMGDGSFELSKMAVAEQERGRGAGRQLLEWIVAEMRHQRAKRLYLETNSKLKNAIHLYEDVGFRDVPAHKLAPSLYERADLFMELLLTN